jgi:hypothetical protein
MAKYPRPKEAEWIQPIAKGYKMMCCDCGLVHKMDFRHVVKVTKDMVMPTYGGKVQFRVWRDERATAAARRSRKKKDILSNV